MAVSEVVGEGALRRQRVFDLSLMGFNQAEIAEKLGVSQPRVSQLLSEGRREWREKAHQTYEEHVTEALARCEMLLRSLKQGIEAGDPRSVDSATKLVDRISRILGLDHRDRMSERSVRVEEAKVQIVGTAVAAMLDHLGVAGEARVEAIGVLQRELERSESA